MELEELRKQIDIIDDELLSLFLKRMDISKKVSEYKLKEHIPILNQKREDEILNKMAGEAGEYGDAAKTLFSVIMDVSRALQHRMIGGGEGLRQLIKDSLSHRIKPAPRLACQGTQGAYSSIAGKNLFPDLSEINFYEQFEDVFTAVENDTADYGIIPIENSNAGSVLETYDLMMKHRLYIVSGIELPIRHKLLAKNTSELSDIKYVYSHSQALSQCDKYIKTHGFEPVPYYNTAMAAEMVANSERDDIAAIASGESASLYGLKILDGRLSSGFHNSTRFIANTKNMVINEGADKISLILGLPHSTGSLYRTLARFAISGLNLTKIESRPILDSNFQYRFYLDFSGSVLNDTTLDLLCVLQNELPQFSFLGNYKELKCGYSQS